MATREQLEVALKVILEGDKAKITDEERRALWGPDPGPQMRALQREHSEWVRSRSVQALGVGKRQRRGRQREQLVIVVYVDQKRPPKFVQKPVPGRLRIPGIGVVETDVVAVGKVEPQVFSDRVRPAMPGCSIGHVDLPTYGTFGLVVKKNGAKSSALFVLSNSHVIAMDGLAAKNDKVIQPGPADVDGSNGTIARLTQWEPFDFTQTAWPNLVDAAIARVTRSKPVDKAIRLVDFVPTAVSFDIEVGMRVHKVGRSSDRTHSKVIDPSAFVRLDYMQTPTTPGVAQFNDQVLCEPYTVKGDSGAPVFNDNDEIVGLHVAGAYGVSIFCKIEHVFAALDVKLA
jgi:hypothetical protein